MFHTNFFLLKISNKIIADNNIGLLILERTSILVKLELNQYYNLIYMQKQSEFDEKVQQAQERIKQNRMQGIELYQRALNLSFNSTDNSWFDYYTAKINLCNHLKDTPEQEWKGRKYLEEILKQVNSKKIEEKLNRKKTQRIKYSTTHALAKLELAFSQKFDILEYYVSYRKAMNESYNHFKDAFNQILQYLINNIENDEEIYQWWTEQYLKLKSNYIGLIFNEAEKFKDKRYFQMIFDEVTKAQQFLKQVYSKKGEIHLYRCFYYKSMSLRLVQKFEQSYSLLLEDYKFELANDELSDAQKSRNQLLRICLDLNKTEEAFSYVDRSDKKKQKNGRELLYLIFKRRQKIKQHFNQSQQILRKCDKQTYLQLFEDFDDQQESSLGLNQYRFDLLLMNKCIAKVLEIYRFKPQVKGLLLYYLAQSNFRLQKYDDAEKYIEEALKFPTGNDIEMRDLKIEEFMIKTKNCKNKGTIQKTYNDLSQQISSKMRLQRDQNKKSLLEDQQNTLIKIYKEYQKLQNKSRETIFYNFQTLRQQELLNLVRTINKKKKEVSFKEKSSVNSEPMDIEKEDECFPIFKKPKKAVAQLNPEEDYGRKCEQFGLFCRESVLQHLTNSTSNPLTQTMNLSVQQMLVITPLLRVDNLDIRNHQVNNEVLASIDSYAYHAVVTQFRVNGINDLSINILFNILKKMGNLLYLSFTNFSSHKYRACEKSLQEFQSQPKSIVEMLSVIADVPSCQISLHNIRVLKLKYCNLLDFHIGELRLQHYSSLQQVSLSHNLIQGSQAHQLMNVARIKRVNLSDNPLSTFSFSSWKTRLLDKCFTLEMLKVKNVNLDRDLGTEMAFAFERARRVNLSQCFHIESFLQPLWTNFLQGKINLGHIEQFVLSNVCFDEPQRLFDILKHCPSLKMVDLRFCSFNNGKINDELYNLGQRGIRVKANEQLNCSTMTFDLKVN